MIEVLSLLTAINFVIVVFLILKSSSDIDDKLDEISREIGELKSDIETLYIKGDKEMYDAIKNTNEDSVFVTEDELKW